MGFGPDIHFVLHKKIFKICRTAKFSTNPDQKAKSIIEFRETSNNNVTVTNEFTNNII